MGGLAAFFGLALLAIVVAVGTDAYITKCQPGSFFIEDFASPPQQVRNRRPWRMADAACTRIQAEALA